MNYFLIKSSIDNKYWVKISGLNRERFEWEFPKLDIQGQFGRLEYAIIWRKFYNKEITREELKIKLG
jgi:hypothetical protein